MKTILKVIGICLLCLILLFVGYIIFMMATDYKPNEKISINIEDNQSKKVSTNKPLTLTTFNIGYCGMDKNEDFFMDGGTMSRCISKEQTLTNMHGIGNEIKKLNSDFLFLQEVDKKATRSYKVNEFDYLKDTFKDYGFTFAINYKVPWVPVPITKPHGQVLAGLTSMSKFNINSSERYSLPGQESFPRQLVELDRCILVNKIPVENNKNLILINAHLSAYDKGGTIRRQQIEFLSKVLEEEYSKGNYVIVGGDWNQQIPGTDAFKFKTTESRPDWLQDVPNTFNPKGFKWAFDENTPSCRTVATPYVKDKNLTAIIDAFMVSDNVEVISTKGTNMEFEYSDHNPVTLTFKLK